MLRRLCLLRSTLQTDPVKLHCLSCGCALPFDIPVTSRNPGSLQTSAGDATTRTATFDVRRCVPVQSQRALLRPDACERVCMCVCEVCVSVCVRYACSPKSAELDFMHMSSQRFFNVKAKHCRDSQWRDSELLKSSWVAPPATGSDPTGVPDGVGNTHTSHTHAREGPAPA